MYGPQQHIGIPFCLTHLISLLATHIWNLSSSWKTNFPSLKKSLPLSLFSTVPILVFKKNSSSLSFSSSSLLNQRCLFFNHIFCLAHTLLHSAFKETKSKRNRNKMQRKMQIFNRRKKKVDFFLRSWYNWKSHLRMIQCPLVNHQISK